MSNKISIRFFDDKELRWVWHNDKRYFSVVDAIGMMNWENDYTKNRNYWKYLKAKLTREKNKLVSATNQLRIKAQDGKMRLTELLDSGGSSLILSKFLSYIYIIKS